MVDVDNNDGYELIEETIQSDATFRSTISIRKSKLVSILFIISIDILIILITKSKVFKISVL